MDAGLKDVRSIVKSISLINAETGEHPTRPHVQYYQARHQFDTSTAFAEYGCSRRDK